jgi:hypothetical protein
MGLAQLQGNAATVWDGPSLSFTNVLGSDPTLPSSQDRLTPNVWLTRGALRGLYNAKTETSYAHFSSPAGTEWAYGELSNYSSLTYQNWETWNGHHPPNMVGQDAVLHLIADDVYLSIRFTAWGMGMGGFSYDRSTENVPEPATGLLLISGFAIIAVTRRFCQKQPA